MDVLEGILIGLLMGLVQGVTEWLPISSSGHLVAGQVFLGYEPPLLFDGLLHLASAAVLWKIFRKDMMRYLKGFMTGFLSIKKKGFAEAFGTQDTRMGWYAIVAIIPTFLMGFFLYKPLEGLFSSLLAVGIAGIVTSGILIASYFFRGGKVTKMGFPRAIAIGIAQAVAIVPGISRSGSTITMGMVSGMDRETAARFSLMLAIPSLLGATCFVLLRSRNDLELDIIPTVVGIITVLGIGYISINLLLMIVKKGGLHLFAVYTLFIGICFTAVGLYFGV